jgi:hypothetical protein
MMSSRIDGEAIAFPRGGFVAMVALYVGGILLGLLFVLLWLTGLALIGLGVAGLGLILLCGYLLPTSLGSATRGDELIIGKEGFQYARGPRVLGNVPYQNVDDIIINQRDGGRSLWIRLKDPADANSYWVHGPESMAAIFNECGYHLVVGQGLPIDAKSLEAKLASQMGSA